MKAKGKRQKAKGWGNLPLALFPFYFFLLTFAAAQPAEPIREVWRRPTGSAECLAISPDGSRCALVTWAGQVLCWAGGRLNWRRVVPGAEQVLLGGSGRAVIYTPLDVLRRDLLVLDDRGRITSRCTAGGPITAVALSPDGQTAAIGTAGGAVELHALEGGSPVRRSRLRGAVQQLYFDFSGGLVATTAEPAWLVALAPTGTMRWGHPAPAGCEFRVGMPPRGAGAGGLTVAAVVAADAGGSSEVSELGLRESGGGVGIDRDRIEIIAFSAAGKPVWRQHLLGRDPHLGVVASSGGVVVAYERAGRRGLVLRFDRALACFGSNGAPRWQHGDMLDDPLLVCASPRGDAILSLCSGNRFWLLSGRGQTLWSYTAAAPIRMACASTDGTSVAIATSDNQLTLLKISPAGRK
jgi:hypothetical protein